MGSIIIKAFPPCDQWLGGERRIALTVDEGLKVKDLLTLLASRYPAFRPLLKRDEDESFRSQMIIVQNGHLLKQDDVVGPEAEIELLPPMAGG